MLNLPLPQLLVLRIQQDREQSLSRSLRLYPESTEDIPTGDLAIGNVSLQSLASRFGTPYYVYDAATLKRRADLLKSLIADCYPYLNTILYASKAYLSPRFAAKVEKLGLGLDAVSLVEMNIAQQAGFSPDRVVLHGNNKTQEEVEAALEWGVRAIVIDSLDELAYVEQLASLRARRPRVWLRINPGVEVDTHAHIQTGHPSSKFGLSVTGDQALEGIRRAASSPHLNLTGLHIHIGSQIRDPAPYILSVCMLFRLAAEAGFIPGEICAGGGWGVAYTADDPDSNPRDWVQAVSDCVIEQSNHFAWPKPALFFEPGRWLVAPAGVAVYQVGNVKPSGEGTRLVAVDGGMADNPRPALYQAMYVCRLIPADGRALGEEFQTSIVGRYCESGDCLIENVRLPFAQRGDLLVMPVAGAYQLSMASNYNLSPRPAVLWVENGQVEVLQEREDLSKGWWGSG